jgi:hypothetical protein
MIRIHADITSSVSYYDFDSPGHSISDKYHNKVMSLSTNTGGVCQFYQ